MKRRLPPPRPENFLAHLDACSLPATAEWMARARGMAGLATYALRDVPPILDELEADAVVWRLVNSEDLRRVTPPPRFTVAAVSSLRVAVVRSVVFHRSRADRLAASSA